MIACDPGNTRSAICAFNGVRVNWVKLMLNADLIKMIRSSGDSLKDQHVVIEMVASYGMIVGQEIFDTCRVIGQIQEAAESMGAKVTLVFRKTVVAHICHSAKASDANIKQALKDRFGQKGTKAAPGIFYGVSGSDQWSAIAIATWGLDNLK